MKAWLVVLAACGGAAPAAGPAKPAAATAAVDVSWDALEGPVREVTVKAADPAVVAKLQALTAGVVGKPLDRAALRSATSQAFGLPGVADVLVRGVQHEDGIELVLEVTPQPIVRAAKTEIAGGAGVALPHELAVATGAPLDPRGLDTQARALREQLVADGYPDASVLWKTRPVGSQVEVTAVVTPGAQVVIDHVELAGNAHATSADLVKAMQLVPGPWDQARVDRAALLVTSYYYDHGYVNVAVQTPAPSAVPTFTIKEGDQYRIGRLSIKDASKPDERKWLALLGVKKGDVFSRSAMTAGLQKLQAATNAEVEPETKLDDKTKTIDVVFVLQKSVSPTSK